MSKSILEQFEGFTSIFRKVAGSDVPIAHRELKCIQRIFWSRRMNDKERLIYKIDSDNVYILACRYHYSDK